MDACALIPSYRPDSRLIETIQTLQAEGFQHIVIVDDGSGDAYAPIFQEAAVLPGVDLVRHTVNMGKGRALKTGFCAILERYPGCAAVAVDGDGQHPADAAMQAARLAEEHPDALILGCRRFSRQKSMPLPNLIGNVLTRTAFFLLTGIHFSDTQCGLRAYPPAVMRHICDVSGDRFELENNTLLSVRRHGIPIVEFEMDVVYAPADEYVTTFRKAADSARIARCLLDFALLPLLFGLFSAVAALCWMSPLHSAAANSWIAFAAMMGGKLLLALCSPHKLRALVYAWLSSALYAFGIYALVRWAQMTPAGAFGTLLVPFALISFAGYRLAAYGLPPERIRLPKSPRSAG